MKRLRISALAVMIILPIFIKIALAEQYTQYPPYDVGFSGGGGRAQLAAAYQYRHSVSLLDGIAKLYARAVSLTVGGAMAESWGYMGIRWTAPYFDPGGGHGGCPYVSTWNGTNYVLDNNILQSSEFSNGTDVEDYYKLAKTVVPEEDRYLLLLSEFESEHSYIDQVQLLAVDHASDVNIAIDREGQILTYKNPFAPISAIDNYGTNRLGQIYLVDGDVSNPTTFFYGNVSDYLVVNFGRVDSNYAKLILTDDIKCELCCIDIQILNSSSQWQTVATVAPRNYWATEGVNLSPYVIENNDFKVRLVWTSPHRLDCVWLDTSEEADCEVTSANLVSATHSTQGNVKELLKKDDKKYAELYPGKQIEMAFTIPTILGQKRDLIFCSKGQYLQTSEVDPAITVSSKLTLKGHAVANAYSVSPFGARARYTFEVWLWVYDLTTSSYVTQTKIDALTIDEEAVAPGGQFWDIKAHDWNEDHDVISSFSAVSFHEYDVYIGVHLQAVVANIGGVAEAILDFDETDKYSFLQYVSLSW